MLHRVAEAALARLAASLIAILLLVLPALAGDRAELNVLGYTKAYRYFAFEEFGERGSRRGGGRLGAQRVLCRRDQWRAAQGCRHAADIAPLPTGLSALCG